MKALQNPLRGVIWFMKLALLKSAPCARHSLISRPNALTKLKWHMLMSQLRKLASFSVAPLKRQPLRLSAS